MEKCVLYLTDLAKSLSCFTVYEATFTESCEIEKCYIVASSLHHASLILYKQLSEAFGSDYLDSHLLCLKFMTVLDHYFSYE